MGDEEADALVLQGREAGRRNVRGEDVEGREYHGENREDEVVQVHVAVAVGDKGIPSQIVELEAKFDRSVG